MLPIQGSLPLSGYCDLYDIVVPKDHLLRRLNDLCGNFDFIFDDEIRFDSLDYSFPGTLLDFSVKLSDLDDVELLNEFDF